MQVKCWLGFKQAGRTDVHQLTFPSRRLVAAVLVPLGLAFSAWEVGHSYERMADGSIRFVPRGADEQILRAAITPRGGEEVALPGKETEPDER